MVTYSRAQWEEADAAWSDFSAEWLPFRDLARQRGFIYPPSGTKWDSWEDAQPSQRAILVRAIRDTPALLERTIRTSRSWREVVARLVEAIATMRDEADEDEELADRRRAEIRAERSQAPERLADIMRRTS